MRFFTVILLVLNGFILYAQDEVDSVVTITPNPFINRLILQESKLYPISILPGSNILSANNPILKMLGGELLKLTDNNIYFHFYRSGKIYKMDSLRLKDSLYVFKRIDNTWNYNYNIESDLFSVGSQLYEIGGYGFWKSNGILRKFNYKDKEWDVVALNREVFPFTMGVNGVFSWIDSTEQYFYVPFQKVINDGILDEGEDNSIVPEAYRLDINNKRWEFLGKTHKETQKILRKATITFSSTLGLLVCHTSRVYFIDYSSNQISILEDPSLGQSLSRLNNSFVSYSNSGWIYWYNYYNQRYDSTFVDVKKFTPLSTPIWEKDWSLFYKVGFLLLLVLGLLWGIVRWRLRARRKLKRLSSLEERPSTLAHPYNETELTLLALLIEKTVKGSTATISEINYVLGIKDKNPGMQKKVRSDVINSINEKFRLLHQDPAQLIQSIRSEADKRYFEYLINPDLLSELQKLVN
ncbi:MAG: hypothetical protein ACO3AY_02910 [Chitinophagaceae bacterium]